MNAPAGFWRRYVAYSVDAFVLAALALPLLWSPLQSVLTAVVDEAGHLRQRLEELLSQPAIMVGDPFSLALSWSADPALRASIATLADVLNQLLLIVAVVLFGLAAVYFIASESSRWQASPGKRLLGLRVTDLAGQRLGPGRTALRFLSGILSWLTFNLGHALAAWTPDKRALHDYLAGARVERLPDFQATMPRWARAWLGLQALAFVGLLAWLTLRYLQLMAEMLGPP